MSEGEEGLRGSSAHRTKGSVASVPAVTQQAPRAPHAPAHSKADGVATGDARALEARPSGPEQWGHPSHQAWEPRG